MNRSTTKAGLLDWARRERAVWEGLVAEVGVARMDEPGPMGAWTFKDLLDHLEAWQAFEQGILEQALTGERPAPAWSAGLDPERDQDRINQAVDEATHARPLPETLRAARATWDRLEEGIATLPESALTDPAHFPWMGGKALGPALVRAATAHLHQDHEVDVRAWLAGAAGTG